jgi:thiamine biosynthesis lipoprotein
MHHIIDPRTSLPSTSDVSQATVVADRCSTAEWAAKAVVVDGTATATELQQNHPAIFAVFNESYER